MSSGVTVITPSLPERADLLAEACASVQAQTLPAVKHDVWLDTARVGPAMVRNRLLDECATTLVAFLDDDDLLYEDHLATLVSALRQWDADLAFSWCQESGPCAHANVPRIRDWNLDAHATMLSGVNLVPVTVVCRKDALLEVGGFDPDDHAEDFGAWLRMLDLGARFVCVPEVTWEYRFLGANRTWVR